MAQGTWREDPVENRKLQGEYYTKFIDPTNVGKYITPNGEIHNTKVPGSVYITDKLQFELRRTSVKAAQELEKAGIKASIFSPGTPGIDENGNVIELKQDDQEEEKKSNVKPWNNPWADLGRRDGRRGASQRMPSDLRYPYSTIDGTQDFLKFSVFEYKRAVRTQLQLSARNRTDFVTSGRESLSQEQGNLRDTRDLLGSVILPIPAQLADTNSIAWGESRMNTFESMLYKGARGGVTGQGDVVRDTFQAGLETLADNKEMVQSYFIKQAVNSLIGGNVTLDQILARSQGEILNPNLELLFSGPTLRNFTFNFKLTPRYKKEAEIIRTIIKSFKRNMAPKGSGGTVLRTPNVFQIEYMGKAKDYLNRMKICALKNVAVNYTGDGTFATYEDGAPISSMLTLSFTELTPIYSEDYAGYDNNEDGVGY